ncbi:MAG: hypothetical protein HZB76_06900 [Chlamydiae bacterium]|nr:hypothetical protein [Chlamydiota bacterium]
MPRTSKVENFTQLYNQICEDINRCSRNIHATAFKINKFMWDYKDLIIFACISVASFILAPYRFAAGTAIFYLAFKNNAVHLDANERGVSTTNLVLNLIGVIGTLFHLKFHSLSNGFIYLTPILSGFVTPNIYEIFKRENHRA